MVTEAALTKSDGDQLCIDKHPRATQHKFEDDMEFSVVYNMLESMFTKGKVEVSSISDIILVFFDPGSIGP